MRAAVYARVSTLNHGQDTNLQLRELREYAERRGWTIVGEYVDEGTNHPLLPLHTLQNL
jgi:DNA invertase Pin-like site-specific DNA recombinase